MGSLPRRGGHSPSDLAPLHDGDRDDLLLRSAGADHVRPPRDLGFFDLRPPQHALLRDDHLLPDRLSDAQGDPRRDRPHRGGYGLQPGELPLAGVPDGDAASDRAGDRERLFAAVRGFARRFRDAAHPGGKQLSHPPHPGLPPDHGALRPEGRGGPLLRPAGPGLRGLSPPAVLGEPKVLRDDHRKGGRQNGDQKRPALDAVSAFGGLSADFGFDPLLLRPALLCLDREGLRRRLHDHLEALPRRLHRGAPGHPGHAHHRGDRDAARRDLQRRRGLRRLQEGLCLPADDGDRLHDQLLPAGNDRRDRVPVWSSTTRR